LPVSLPFEPPEPPEPPELWDTRLKLIVEVADKAGNKGVFTRTFRSHQQVRTVLQWLRSLGVDQYGQGRVRITDIRLVD